MIRTLLLSTILGLAGSISPAMAAEKPFLLGRPLACSLDGPCWIAQYPDHDAGPDARDSGCGLRSYNTHDGTDFAIPDQKTLISGVDVLAIADGTVLRSRDGVQDQKYNPAMPDNIKGIECGNGVLIDHGNGWQSQYCHMKQGSLTIKPGDKIRMGQALGQVGQSGKAEFPHLHITLRKDNKAIDPFTASPITDACITSISPKKDLWRDDAKIHFTPVSITKIGFSGKKPEQAQLEQDSKTSFRKDSDALILWTEIWGVRAGDSIQMIIQDQDGNTVFDHTEAPGANKARLMQYGGIKRKTALWSSPRYTGIVRLIRDQMPPVEKKIILSPE